MRPSRPGPAAGSSGSSPAGAAANSVSAPSRRSPSPRPTSRSSPTASWRSPGATPSPRSAASRAFPPWPRQRGACSNRGAAAGAADGTSRTAPAASNVTPSPASATGRSPRSTAPTRWTSPRRPSGAAPPGGGSWTTGRPTSVEHTGWCGMTTVNPASRQRHHGQECCQRTSACRTATARPLLGSTCNGGGPTPQPPRHLQL